MKDSFEDQIYKIVLANPGINQNEIWRKAKDINGKPTFEKVLKNMIDNKILVTKKDLTHSQKKLFFVNSEVSDTLSRLIDNLDFLDEVLDKHQYLVFDFLKKHSFDDSSKITKGIIDVFSILIDEILNVSNASLTYNLMGNQMFYHKAERIRVKNIEKLQKSLKLLRKKHSSVFKDLIAFVMYKLEIPF
jgi:hypothetical protein